MASDIDDDTIVLEGDEDEDEDNHRQHLRPIVFGCSVLYNAQLAKGMARRFVEACRDHQAWVIVGDDDTGECDGGREIFLEELDRLLSLWEKQNNNAGVTSSSTTSFTTKPNTPIRRVWTHSTVQNDKLGWRNKTVHLLLLNPPASIIE